MKTCTKCGETKEFSEFHKSIARKDGYVSQCKQCSKDRKKNLKNDDVLKLQKEIRSSIIIENKFLIKNGQKICSCCKKIYTPSALRKNQIICKDCDNKNSREWYKKNIEKRKESLKEYRLNKKLEKEQQILLSK